MAEYDIHLTPEFVSSNFFELFSLRGVESSWRKAGLSRTSLRSPYTSNGASAEY